MTMVFGNDFRQVLPVIPKGSRQDIVSASIKQSYLWDHCKVLKLTKNMRLTVDAQPEDVMEIRECEEWILKVRDGELGEENDGEREIDVPEEILIDQADDSVASIVDFTYPNILDNIHDPLYFKEKAILAPTYEVVDNINEHLLDKFLGEEMVYLSCNNVDKTERDDVIDKSIFSSEFINGLKFSDVPNHRLALKVGVPVMLLRNIDQPNGLYKRLLLKIFRKQFPLSVSFVMTINKSQGLKVVVCDKDGNISKMTTNVVYKEVLHGERLSREVWASCNVSNKKYDGGSLRNIEIRCYWESENDNDRINIERNDLSLNNWLKIKFGEVEETIKKKILTEHWRKKFGVDYNEIDDFYDPEQCGEGRNNKIRERIINNLHEEWFKGTSDDEEGTKGIIDYLEPTLYEGFIDLDDEDYNKRRCRLLGMAYIELLPIIIEQVKITRYSLGPGEVYTKLEVSNMEELLRTRRNIATVRSNIMDEVFEDET
ncbi:ATP-dependent DNA helicase PIF1-like protein [Tanacetum coccineum]